MAKPYARLCNVFAQFLSTWAKRLSISGVARAFSVNWSTVYEAVEEMVEWGLEHRNLAGIEASNSARSRIPVRPFPGV